MRPPLFADLTFDAALAAAKAEKKLLLVDATASWCQPCKHMDKTTWVDGKVTERIRADGIAIQIDVDEQKELAQKLRVRAMPTVIAFRDGAEIDRVTGMRPPATLLEWLDALARGETSLDAARAEAKKDPKDLKARMAFSRMLLEGDTLDEATTEHVSLWSALDADPKFAGVKHSFFLKQLAELVGRHPPAGEAFKRIRDAAEPGTLDWFTLNVALKETDRTLTWFESVRDRTKTDDKLAEAVETFVIPILIKAGRWEDAGNAYARPMKTFERLVDQRKRMLEEGLLQVPEEQRAQVKTIFEQVTLAGVTTLRRALHEAHRDEDLRAVEEAAAKVDPAWITPLPK